MITLYQFPGIWGLPNASPFCLKLETYLRMAEVSYDIRFVMDPRKSPKGKLPYIKLNNEVIPDTEFIIDLLKKRYGDVLDKQLSAEQKALVFLLDVTFSDRLYWLMLYFRWQDDAGWVHVKSGYFKKLPFFLRLFIPSLIRKQTKKALYAQGFGRHKCDEVLKIAHKTLDAIATILGQNKYFLGNEITSIDASAFGFLANIVWLPYDDPLKIYLQKKHSNILSYCDRIWNTFYPELSKPFAIS